MADTKISDMAAATAVADADLIPIVQGGVNLSATRALLLSGDGAENVALVAGSGSNAAVRNTDFSNVLVIPESGQVQLLAGTSILLHTVGQIRLQSDGGQNVVDWTDPTPGNWDTSVPTSTSEALVRIASALAGLLGGPIP